MSFSICCIPRLPAGACLDSPFKGSKLSASIDSTSRVSLSGKTSARPSLRAYNNEGEDRVLKNIDESENVGRRSILNKMWLSAASISVPTIVGNLVLAENASAVVCELKETSNGLAFCDTLVGEGLAAESGMLIKAHYTGRLENGSVFDSSYKRGSPLVFQVGVGQVIKGWDQGIIGNEEIPPMAIGGKRTLRIPSELAYGSRGAGCRGGSCAIPPNSVLIFDVEFVGKVK